MTIADCQLSRRDFLTAAAAGLATSSLNTVLTAAEEDNFIDAHVHVWTADTEHFPLASGFTRQDMQPPSFTPEELFALCRPQGVKRAVLVQMSFYQFDNRYMLAAMRRYPGVFSGVGIVDDSQPDVRDRMQELAAQGVRGFRLYATKENAESWKNSPGVRQMWSYGAESGLAMCLLTDPEALPAVLGMCQEFPQTRVVIDHFARIGKSGMIDQVALETLCCLADFPHTSVKTSAFYALGKKQAPYTDLAPMIRRLRDAFGASRLMWATDCPYQVQRGHTYADSLALIRDRLDFLSVDDKRAMLRTTAERIFF